MDVQFLAGDLTEAEVDAIVNPANSECVMDGGVAGAIKKAGGKVVEEEAMERAPVAIGKAILTGAGKLPCDFIIHAPLMKMPLQKTSAENIARATRAALVLAERQGLTRIAFPGMGTGVGSVPLPEAAAAMIEAIRKFGLSRDTISEIFLTDQNEEMIEAWQESWERAAAPDQE